MDRNTRSIKKFNEPLLKEQVELKFRRMNKNIYSFFRGTCHLFYERLSKEKKLPFSPAAWICGDLHFENFGSYKGANRLVYFDLNDFDESILAPASYELIRFVTSIFIAFKFFKIDELKARHMANIFLKTYSQTLAKGKSFYIEPQIAQGIVREFLQAVSRRKQAELMEKCTYVKGKKRLLVRDKKKLPLKKKEKKELKKHMDDWIINNSGRPYNYKVADVVFRVAGLGSLGLKRYLFLLKSTNVKEKYLLVDMKQSRSSSLAPFVKVPQPRWKSEAERVSTIQERMENMPPFLLSTVSFEGDSYVVQELQPTKDNINLKLIRDQYRDIYQVISDMAMLTASSQLRSAGRQNAATADELIQFGESQSWQESLIRYSIKYAGLVQKQYIAFRRYYKAGEI